tara:strand:- start:1503 stop:1949 length:447 start_codon:yes stop_codon:yes gene_type:complete
MGKYKPDKSAWRVKPLSKETPWGTEKQWSALPGVNGKILSIKKDHRTSLKYHRRKNEAFYVLSGKVKFVYADEDWLHYNNVNLKEEILEAGDSMCVQSNCVYRIHALEESRVVEIGSYGNDAGSVRIDDDYGRKVTKETLPNFTATEK